MEEEAPAKGFDRDIDYIDIKKKLIKEVKCNYDNYISNPRNVALGRLIYGIIACIQLRNGSRISEAVKSFYLFNKRGIDSRVTVKISKSDAIKTKKDGTKKKLKPRFREIMFPDTWFDKHIFNVIADCEETNKFLTNTRLKKRVLDYLLNNFNCNTHSLRYAFINYMLYDKKRPMNDVAKFVGHVNTNQLTTYTQLKNTNKIFDLDI
jgi:hypothetical protein